MLDASTAHAIAAVVSGDPAAWDRTAVELARGSGNGMEPGQAAEAVQAAYGIFEEQVARAVAPQIGGLAPENRAAFYLWAQSNARGELQQDTTRLVYENNVSGWKALAARYARSRG